MLLWHGVIGKGVEKHIAVVAGPLHCIRALRGYWTQVCFAITCNPVPRNATALGPTEVCVHWVIWRLCVCFPSCTTCSTVHCGMMSFFDAWVIAVQFISAPLHCWGIYNAYKMQLKQDKGSPLHLLNISLEHAWVLAGRIRLWRCRVHTKIPFSATEFRIKGLYQTQNCYIKWLRSPYLFILLNDFSLCVNEHAYCDVTVKRFHSWLPRLINTLGLGV